MGQIERIECIMLDGNIKSPKGKSKISINFLGIPKALTAQRPNTPDLGNRDERSYRVVSYQRQRIELGFGIYIIKFRMQSRPWKKVRSWKLMTIWSFYRSRGSESWYLQLGKRVHGEGEGLPLHIEETDFFIWEREAHKNIDCWPVWFWKNVSFFACKN